MKTVPYSFAILTYLGGWRPVIWTSGLKTKFYALYTFFVILLVYTFTLMAFIDLLKPIDDVAEFTNNCFILLTLLGACTKITNILVKRRRIIDLVGILEKDMCLPRNDEENMIQNKFDRLTRRNTYLFGALVDFSVFAITGSSLLSDLPQRVLPFKAWIPYSLEYLPSYLFAYFHQLVANFICANFCVANETLVTGLMVQTCAQLSILRYRLENLPNEIQASRNRKKIGESEEKYEDVESKIFANCIKHHHRIIQFARTLNEIFNVVIFVQFSASTTIVCTSLFKLTKISVRSVDFFAVAVYLLTMLMQIFIYCWYGNEVMLESTQIGNAAYNMDWTLLKVSTRKSILLLMMSSLRPIKFTSAYVIILSVNTYNSIIKLSYSAYNGLQQSSNGK